MGQSAVAFTNICKSYVDGRGQQRHVLQDVNGSIEQGQRVALMGKSGSGKSTLLHCLGCIDQPDSGTITLAEQTCTGLPERKLAVLRRDHIGFIYQQLNLIPTLSVEDNTLLRCDLAGKVTSEQRQRSQQLLERVGLADRRDAMPDELSGGERQRVAIVSALVHGPQLVLADEPTGSLDASNGQAVLDLLVALQEEDGCSLIIATHDPEIAKRCPIRWDMVDGNLQQASE